MATNIRQMMADANAAVPRITPTEAGALIAKGNAVAVDVRDASEVARTGKVAGALHISHGLSEFQPDPESPAIRI